MKRIYLLLTAMTMFLASYAQEIHVSNAKDFLKSIDDNRTIIIESNSVLNLTEALLQLHKEDSIKYPRFKYVSLEELFGKIFNAISGNQEIDDDLDTPQKGIYIQDEKNGPRVCIAGIKNLTIKGEGPVAPMLISELLLEFNGCSNLTLDNLALGGLNLTEMKKASITNCDLRGDGLNCYDLSNLNFVNCQIHDSHDGIIQALDCGELYFEHCAFFNCSYEDIEIEDNEIAKMGMIFVYPGKTVCFNKCGFYQNQGRLFGYCPSIKLKNCFVSHPNENRGDISEIKDKKSVWFDTPK